MPRRSKTWWPSCGNFDETSTNNDEKERGSPRDRCDPRGEPRLIPTLTVPGRADQAYQLARAARGPRIDGATHRGATGHLAVGVAWACGSTDTSEAPEV